MKRHFFTFFIFILCGLSWIIVLKGGVKSADIEEPFSVSIDGVSKTPILGDAKISIEQARSWAEGRGATEDFINIADVYWEIGTLMGIRADVLYAQSAKETAFGRYAGNVTADMNNWAGIKRVNATGDERDDHESFATSEAGVQGHFNHMAAYVGVEPLGMIHQRYYTVLSIGWAGTVKFVEDLSGKWAPAVDYGESVVNDFLNTMNSE